MSTLQGLLISSIDGLIKFINESYEFRIAKTNIHNILLLQKEPQFLINYSKRLNRFSLKMFTYFLMLNRFLTI